MNSLYIFFSSLRWQDILDICINSYILFRLYALFRGTATFRVLVGLAFLWFFQRLSLSLGLIVTSWAIQGITAAAAIIIIVIFRNEIRTVFQTKNMRAILWGVPQKIHKASIEVLSDVVFDLAETHVGALLVYPGKDDLDEHVQNCIPWQGVVSKEMIRSIFWRDNPVHDGAAIVEGDRVSKVACILPLSLRDDLPPAFGTRHRAAAGLSEKSDALVVVVSEERGQVATAKGGVFSYPKSRAGLRVILEDHIGRKTFNAKAEKNERFEMITAACLSFLLISSVWFGFTRSLDTLVSFEVPIQYTGRVPGIDIVGSSDDVVRVHVIGAGALIRSVRADQVAVNIDLGTLPLGVNTLRILPNDVSLPPGVALNRVTPSEIEITLDKHSVKTLPVQADWSGRLPDNLLLTEATLDPPQIQVTGRSLLLKELGTLYTEKIPLGGVDKNGKISAAIVFPDKIKPSPGQKDRITVFYKVKTREKPPTGPPAS
jgi:diadenylate cyclase